MRIRCAIRPPRKRRRVTFHGVALALGIACSWAVGAFAQEAAEQEGARSTLHVATLNMAHGRGTTLQQFGVTTEVFRANLQKIAEVMAKCGADVIALQEADGASLWSGGFDHVALVAQVAGYPNVHHGLHFDVGRGAARIACGTALLSRLPIHKRESQRFRDDPIHAKGFVSADIEFDRKLLTVVSLHLHSGSKQTRLQEAEQIVEALRPITHGLILMGDFNATWSSEDNALRIIAQALELRAYEPTSEILNTYPSTAPRKRIDWILISKDLEFVSYRIWPDEVSDHLGVEAVIRRREDSE